ncbi:MAG TPA: hypothetical protein VFM04_09820 [Candidatus Methylomirabilis sp.]|nr:hypothetical protein [Candidatus Methylomirabilis sp.]
MSVAALLTMNVATGALAQEANPWAAKNPCRAKNPCATAATVDPRRRRRA